MTPAAQRVVEQAARALGGGKLSVAWWDPARALLVQACGAPVAPDSVAERAFSEQQTVLMNGVVATPLLPEDGSSGLGVLVLEEVVGPEVARLEALAPLVTRALLHSDLAARQNRELAIVAALADVRAAASQAVDPVRCAVLICKRLEAILTGAAVSIYILSADGGHVDFLAAGSPQEWKGEWRTIPAAGEHIVARALAASEFEAHRVLDHPTATKYGMHDSLAVALRDGGRPFGVVIASAALPFDREALELVTASARAASVGLALALGMDAQRRAERRSRLLAALAFADPPDGVRPEAAIAWLRGLARSAGDALDARCNLAAPGAPSGATPNGTPRLGMRALQAVVSALKSNQIVRDDCVLALPVAAGDVELGVLALETNGRAVDPEDESLLSTLGARVAAAVERGKLADARRRAEREKDEVLSIVAHELRTPITSLQGFAAASLAGIGGLSEARVRRAFEIIERQARRMGGLVGDLLDVTRIERGQLELRREWIDLAALASEVIERVAATAPRHQLVLESTGGAEVEADLARLEQVLVNLLHNAVRYSPAGGTVTVRVGREPGGAVRCDVCDQGVGVLEADRARIFERFQRSAGPDQSGEPGLGLGLYIAREIATRHGGALWLSASEVGRGSVFSLRLGGQV